MTLAAHLADRMRTPLTCILGYVDLLLDDPAHELRDEQRRHLEAIVRSARALERLAGGVEEVAEAAPPGDGPRNVVDLAARRAQAARRRGGR